jgi:serine protease
MVSLSVETEGNGKVIAFPGTGEIPEGETVMLVSKADAGWAFQCWIHEGQTVCSTDEYTFKITENYSITAKFLPQQTSTETLGYRLEAGWESYSKTDRLLCCQNSQTEDNDSKALETKTTSTEFKKVSYVNKEADTIHKERAILVKYLPSYSASSLSIENKLKQFGVIDPNYKPAGLLYERILVDETNYNSITSLLEKLRETEGIASAEEDILYSVHTTPNDPLYSFQWNMENLAMPAVWDVTTGEESVIVAVIDTGVYFLLEDLNQTQFLQGYDFYNGYPNAFDDNGHGSHVTGTIAQSTNNELGVSGIATNIKILPVKVLDFDGSGYSSDVAQGIIFAVNNDADIINLSLGGEASAIVDEACQYASDQGVLVIASTGNDGAASINYPAALPQVIAVGAVNDINLKAPYSNYGTGLDIMAPGGDFTRELYNEEYDLNYSAGIIQNTINPEDSTMGYFIFEGTSMAAPHVAGLAALIKSKNPSLTAEEIKDILYSTADDYDVPGYDVNYGYGIINPVKALEITPYVMNDSINSSIDRNSGSSHRWRLSSAESMVSAKLDSLEDGDNLSLRLEKSDGTILATGTKTGDSLQLDYEVGQNNKGYVYLIVSYEE